MIKKISISVDKWIYAWLAPHWRKTTRLALHGVLMTPFTVMMSEFITWRDEAIIKANVTGETIALEWYLNRLFDSTLKRITIHTNTDGGIDMGIRDIEPAYYQDMGIRDTEPTYYQDMTIEGEDSEIGLYDFGVTIPAAISAQEDDIKAIINQFRLAGKKFIIIVS